MEDYLGSCKKVLFGYLDEIDFLIKAQKYQLSFLVMSQMIELLGAFIDDKPLRAKDQSKKRFNLALKKLFNEKYFYANEKNFLYLNYRCNMSHLLVSGNSIVLTGKESEGTKTHLSQKEGKLILVAEDLYLDTKNAVNKVLLKIQNKEVKEKKGLLNQD